MLWHQPYFTHNNRIFDVYNTVIVTVIIYI
nr:MAG TPA: hypothetical protein [Caudoviricetes sp.]